MNKNNAEESSHGQVYGTILFDWRDWQISV
jgi:hypothetical protein